MSIKVTSNLELGRWGKCGTINHIRKLGERVCLGVGERRGLFYIQFEKKTTRDRNIHSQNREVLEHKGGMEVRYDTDKRGE